MIICTVARLIFDNAFKLFFLLFLISTAAVIQHKNDICAVCEKKTTKDDGGLLYLSLPVFVCRVSLDISLRDVGWNCISPPYTKQSRVKFSTAFIVKLELLWVRVSEVLKKFHEHSVDINHVFLSGRILIC
jgi:hypothetical protein